MIRSALLLAAFTFAAPLLAGCASILGDQTAEVDFNVEPRADGTYFYWNDITVGGGGVDAARLLAVTLDTLSPEGTPDLTYMENLTGVGVAPSGERTPFCSVSSFPRGEEAVVADVLFHDNIVPFFDSSDTLRIEWSGAVNPSVIFPDGGFEVRARLKVSPQ
ncbi:MAG TPA: hypothetical protein VHB21_05375 [Minicystis sp.]|nr:hypothetical protein [Minicystis sp.]